MSGPVSVVGKAVLVLEDPRANDHRDDVIRPKMQSMCCVISRNMVVAANIAIQTFIVPSIVPLDGRNSTTSLNDFASRHHLGSNKPNVTKLTIMSLASTQRGGDGRPPCRRRPVIISDVLDTLVRDPFYNGMAAHFNFESMQQFIDAKTPDVWVEFEKGLVSEEEFTKRFFKDGRDWDLPNFKRFLLKSYQLLPGIDHMLTVLRDNSIPVHACSNYPSWADLIEQSVKLQARFDLHWTFVSCKHGLRKPDQRVYTLVSELAAVEPSSCVFIDDRQVNCDGAKQAGMIPIKFDSAEDCQRQLQAILSSEFDVHIDFGA